MATLQITEFADAQIVDGVQLPIGKTAQEIQNVTYTTNAASSGMRAGTKFVRLIADAAAYITFDGTAATANSIRLPADTVEYFGVEKGTVINVYDGTS